jgi:hypothetical protein
VLRSRVIDALPDGDEGHGFGLVRTAYMLLGSTGSVTTSVLAGTLGWAGAITVNVGILGVGIAALLANRAFDRGP